MNNRMGIDKKFNELVCDLQEINKEKDVINPSEKHLKQIERIGKKIFDLKLIEKCKNQYFARQLMNANDVPLKYWKK